MWLPFLVTIIVLAAVAELLQIDLYGNDGVSVSVATLVAGSLLCGLTGATLTAAAIAFAGGIVRWRNRANAPFYTDALNGAISMISGSSIAILVSQSGLSLNAGNLPSLTALMIPIGLAFALVNTGLLATRHSLQFGQPLVAIWRERYQWLTVHHIVLCMLGLFLTIAYVTFGFFGLVTFILPVAMMHYVEKQYIERTREHVLRLEQLNQQLSRKNTETTHASVVVQQLNQELRYASTSVARLNDELFETLAKIIDTHDPSMSSHSTRVARLAVALGKRIGVPDAEIVGLRRAALLHDIGKIGVSEAILQKPARLTPREYETVKTHVSLGVAMLESAQSLRSLIPMVRHHHERWDGRGYPDQIASAAIPLGARVIAICDAVDVMSVDRPYHHAMPAHEVIAELRRSSSAHFDPALVTAMIELIEDGLLEPAETEGLTTLAI
jgi:putative nucleotidyltransferase with HDIG domain